MLIFAHVNTSYCGFDSVCFSLVGLFGQASNDLKAH